MKIFQLYFILLSKLYVRFSKRKEDWYYMPLMILSSLLGFNTFVFTSIFVKVNPYYFIGAVIICFLILTLFFGSFAKNKEFVENFKLSKQTKIFLVSGIFINIFILVQTLNYIRDKRITEKPREKYNYLNLKNYEIEHD